MATATAAARKAATRRAKTAREASKSLLPLHHRVYIVLRRKLTDGEFPPDQPLPGEHQLAANFEVSRETVRRVLDRLASEGLVDRRHGSGTFPIRPLAGAADDAQLSYYDFIAALSHTYDDELLEFAYIPTPALITTGEAGFGPVVLKVSRLRRREGRAVHIVDSYLPGELAPLVTRENVGNRTLLEILRKRDIHAHTSEFRVGAVAADSEQARQLGIEIGAPLVHATRLSRTAQGRPIEFSRFLSVAELFGYSFTFDSNAIKRQSTALPPGPAAR